MPSKEHVILGIDPGTNIMGYGIIACKGNQVSLLRMGVVKTTKNASQHEKLKSVFDATLSLIDAFKPEELSIESTFFGKNVQSMLKLGRAQGVAIAAAMYRGLEVYEYSPRRIKQSVTGRGNSSKEQVASMLERLLGQPMGEAAFDATDALAVAVCHFLQKTPETSDPIKHTGWKAFIADNPGRIK